MLALYEQQNGHFSFFGWPKPKKAQYREDKKRQKMRERERVEGRGERFIKLHMAFGRG